MTRAPMVRLTADLEPDGARPVLNGVALLEAEGESALVLSTGRFPATIKVYYDPATDYMFEGETLAGVTFNLAKAPHRPMSIALPGAPDFVTTKPAFCGSNLS